MYDLCACDSPAALTTIDNLANTCIPGKIAKMFFQRKSQLNNFVGAGAAVPGTNPINEEASWTGLTSAVDDSKVTVTPFLEEVAFAEADLLEDSENFDGAPIAIDSSAVPITAIIRNIDNVKFNALKTLQCERDLVVYFVDARGNFFVNELATETHNGFDISPDTFIVKDPSRGTGKVDQFKTMIQFHFASSWFSGAVKVVPEDGFTPLSEVVAP